MLFYDNSDFVSKIEKSEYEQMLIIMGSLSNLYSDNISPYIPSRVTENLFCKYLEADNLARSDVTADAKKKHIGIGIKTWIGSNRQKIAEFDKALKDYSNKSVLDKIQHIAQLRNERIRFTMASQGLSEMIYHCILRKPGLIQIFECPLVPIDIDHLQIKEEKSTTITFTDGSNNYSFALSKSTLYKDFVEFASPTANGFLMAELPVQIIEDPYEFLRKKMAVKDTFDASQRAAKEPGFVDSIILPLFTYAPKTGEKIIPLRSGLNQWNANGRRRNPDEVYIGYNADDKKCSPGFFPPKEQCFTLLLPDGESLSAKICQDGEKAIMSNPNSALGKWLLRKVLHIPLSNTTPLTYDDLERYGIDAVEFRKYHEPGKEPYYKIDFARIGSYEAYIQDKADQLNVSLRNRKWMI